MLLLDFRENPSPGGKVARVSGSEEECGRLPNDLELPDDFYQGLTTKLRISLISFVII